MGYQYGMTLGFDGEAVRHSFTLRCLPGDTLRQRVVSEQVSVTPEIQLVRGSDGFGNITLEGLVLDPHRSFSVQVQGAVETKGDLRGCPVPEAPSLGDDGIFRYQTALTEPGPAIASLIDRVQVDRGDDLATAIGTMHAVHSALQYSKGRTGPDTTAEEALRGGAGVCQDFAQIMISTLRCLGIPCRYVVGYSVGEGESHAWAEVLSDGFWYGLDPTGDRAVGTSHIKVSHGRDFGDCRINRGVFFGAVETDRGIRASVTPI